VTNGYFGAFCSVGFGNTAASNKHQIRPKAAAKNPSMRDSAAACRATTTASKTVAWANGVTKDIAAVTAAITSGWSNGQTEGQICKLKLVERQMYGRGELDLLQARVIGFG
jgi:transposase